MTRIGPSRRRCCAPGSIGRIAPCRASTTSPQTGPASLARRKPGRRRADRLLSGVGSVGQYRAGRRAGPALCGPAAAPVADLRPEPEGRRGRGAARRRSSPRHPPAVILNATGFSVRAGAGEDPLAAADCPVLQVVFSGGDEESWRAGTRGLAARDLAMNVALPEIDGRILSRAVSFKAPPGPRSRRPRVDLVGYRPVADRDRLCRRPRAQLGAAAREAAGRAAGRVDPRQLSGPRRPYRQRRRPRHAGFGAGDPAMRWPMPATASKTSPTIAQALIGRLTAGPTNANPGAPAEETFSFAEYSVVLRHPAARRCSRPSSAAGGRPSATRFSARGGSIAAGSRSPAFRAGNVAVLIQPARGYGLDPKATYHDPALAPPHAYLAAYAWLAHDFRADAVIHLGKHGTLEWLPGKALALSAECFPEAVLPPLPHLYPFIVNDPGEGTQAKRRAQAVIVDHLTPPLTRAGSYGADGRARAADRRILRGAPRRSAAGRDAGGGDPRTGAGGRARRRLRHRRRRRSAGGPAQARRAPLRDQGIADPRWAPCLRQQPRGRAARRAAGRLRPARPRRRRRGRLPAARPGRRSRSRRGPARLGSCRALDRSPSDGARRRYLPPLCPWGRRGLG